MGKTQLRWRNQKSCTNRKEESQFYHCIYRIYTLIHSDITLIFSSECWKIPCASADIFLKSFILSLSTVVQRPINNYQTVIFIILNTRNLPLSLPRDLLLDNINILLWDISMLYCVRKSIFINRLLQENPQESRV